MKFQTSVVKFLGWADKFKKDNPRRLIKFGGSADVKIVHRMRCQETYPRTTSHPCFTETGYVLENGIVDSNIASMIETLLIAYAKYFLKIGVNVNVSACLSVGMEYSPKHTGGIYAKPVHEDIDNVEEYYARLQLSQIYSLRTIKKGDTIAYTKEQNDRWHEMYERLLAYKKKHGGSTLVPIFYEPDQRLARWARKQRSLINGTSWHGVVPDSEYRIRRLNSLGFVSCQRTIRWLKLYDRFQKYVNEHNGSTAMPLTYRNVDNELFTWRDICIADHRNNRLQNERRKLLLKLNFEFDHQKKSQDLTWDYKFSLLKKYKKKKGHCSMGARYKTDDGEPLGRWVNGQRCLLRDGTMKSERKRKLEELGVEPN